MSSRNAAGLDWADWLFFALALAFLVPLWSATYGPSTDGPSHLYNAFVLRLIAVGSWWRRRHDPDLVFALRINAILLLCYFSHLVSSVMALLAIAVLWLATLKRNGLRRRLRHVAVLAPQLLLPLWFLWA